MKFRSELLFGEGYRDAIDVCAYEFQILGNTDVLEYLKEHQLHGTPIADEIEELLTQYEDIYYIEDFNEDDYKSLFRRIFDALFEATGNRVNYCLWLADYNGVLSYAKYGVLADTDIDAYEEGAEILSDLGTAGILYGYETNPKPIGTYADVKDKTSS